MEQNKVKYNVKNLHYAPMKAEMGENGMPTYDTPVKIPGTVSISLSPEGELEEFYADGIVYYTSNGNQGYSGDVENAYLTDEFRKYALGETEDQNKVLVENANAELGKFALLFEFDGDKHGIRHVLYNCVASRPSIEGKTNEASKTPQTDTVTIKATPLENGIIKAKSSDATTEEAYKNWYTTVYIPEASEAV